MCKRRFARAQSLTEFALATPLLLALFLGIIELALILGLNSGLSNSAREGARAGSVYRYTGAPVLSSDTGAVATIDAQRAQYVNSVINSTLNPMIAPTQITVTVSYTPTASLATNPYRAGDTVVVQIEHRHLLFFGIFGQQDMLIRGSSAMRIERGGAQ